jgi:GNAT superfamily N-acetyltransferase
METGSTPVIAIRAAADADVPALARLATELGYPAQVDDMRERFARVCDEGAGIVLVAADAQAEVLGWTHVVARLNLEEAPFAELAGLIVADGARSLGIGAALLHAAEAWALEQGLSRLRVRSNVLRERAHEFYRRWGYVERKRQVVFDKPLG